MPVPPAYIWVPNQWPLSPPQSCLSANYYGANVMTLEDVHRSPRIYLTAEEIPGKLQLVYRVMKAVRPVIA
jgi:hypothetical protein